MNLQNLSGQTLVSALALFALVALPGRFLQAVAAQEKAVDVQVEPAETDGE